MFTGRRSPVRKLSPPRRSGPACLAVRLEVHFHLGFRSAGFGWGQCFSGWGSFCVALFVLLSPRGWRICPSRSRRSQAAAGPVLFLRFHQALSTTFSQYWAIKPPHFFLQPSNSKPSLVDLLAAFALLTPSERGGHKFDSFPKLGGSTFWSPSQFSRL